MAFRNHRMKVNMKQVYSVTLVYYWVFMVLPLETLKIEDKKLFWESKNIT